MFQIHKLTVPGFMISFLWIFRIGCNIDNHEHGNCANFIVAISKLEIAFSVGLRNSEPLGEGYGQA